MEDTRSSESVGSASYSSASFQGKGDASVMFNAAWRNAQMVHTLLHEVLPFSLLGVLQNQLAVSPPLALVATAPEVRVYCEEHAPYFLGGTWWLAHTTTHCVVRCRVAMDTERRMAGVDDHVPSTPYVPEGVECIFSYPHPSSSGHDMDPQHADAEQLEAHAGQAGGRRGSKGDEADESTCWVSEEVLLLLQEEQRLAQGSNHGHGDVVAGSVSAPDVGLMARHSGVMALVPPQLKTSRCFLSFVQDLPTGFFGFCTLAAQHGWQSAARTLLQHLIDSTCDAEREDEALPMEVGPSRLYVVYTQLYAICGYSESRIAHSAWWCLRRAASAMGAASLSPVSTLSHDHRLAYCPAVLPTPCASVNAASTEAHPVKAFMAHNEGDPAFPSLLRFRSHQQMPSLQSALRYTRAQQRTDLQSLFGGSSEDALRAGGFASNLTHTGRAAASTWAVTNAFELTVFGDITFFNPTSTVDPGELLQQHWYPFFRPLYGNGMREQGHYADTPGLGGTLRCHAKEAAHCAAPASEATAACAAVPLPPPCALFLHGNVIQAVEHKLHREAVRARAAAKRPQTSNGGSRAHREMGAAGLPLGGQNASATAVVDEEEDVVDVQPLLFDMTGDEHDQAVGPPRCNGLVKHPPGSRDDASALWYDPLEERFLNEIVHRESFQLLHCIDVTYLRLPLGPELIAERPMQLDSSASKSPGRCPSPEGEGTRTVEETEVWDARWLSCLFPRVQVLDVEGPPSFTHASPAASAGAVAGAPGGEGNASRAGAVPTARQYWRMVRPRELTFSLGAAAAAQTRTAPLHAIYGLWRLRELHHLVLRAYPFRVLPALVAPSCPQSLCEGPLRASREVLWLHAQDEDMHGAGASDGGSRGDSCKEAALPRVIPRAMKLSVMGWPYVDAAGLRHLVSTSLTAEKGPSTDDACSGSGSAQQPFGAYKTLRHGSPCAAPDLLMLSLTHIDSLALVDALQAVFPHMPSSLPPSLLSAPLPSQLTPSLAHLTQLELSKTRVNTAVLEQMNLPVRTPQLQVLRLSATPVDNVTSLVGLQSLRVLNLASSGITKSGLRRVQWMPALEELYLTQCECLFHGPEHAIDERIAGHEEESAGWSGWGIGSQGGTNAPGVNIFSLGVASAHFESQSPTTKAANAQRGWQTFPALRVLDLSNNPQLTEQALCYKITDNVLLVEVTCRPYEASGAGERDTDGRYAAPMQQLHTLLLMHTSMSHLACLLVLCPQLRAIDASFTPLREEGLWACVQCPRRLPLSRFCEAEGEAATRRGELVYSVHFPKPLQLQQLNISGVPLSSLYPLSCAPPLDWAYTALEAGERSRTAAGREMEKTSSSASLSGVHIKESTQAQDEATGGEVRDSCKAERLRGSDVPHQSTRRAASTALVMYPNPAIIRDCAIEVHLLTQQRWLQCAKEHPHELQERTHRSKRMRMGWGLQGACPVRVPDPSGYTICVDAEQWAAAQSCGHPYSIDDSMTLFDAAKQWTPSPLRHGDRHSHEAEDDRRSEQGAIYPLQSSSLPWADSVGGFGWYGVIQLSCLRQLRLEHSNITASGLAAGYGMPQQHTGDVGMSGGLAELSLRCTPFLCPPYPLETRRREEVHAAAAMTTQREQQQLLHDRVAPPPPPFTHSRGLHAGRVAQATSSTTITQARDEAVTSALQWTEADALCAVLRLHSASLQLLNVSHTSVALSTVFGWLCRAPSGAELANENARGRAAAGPTTGAGENNTGFPPLRWEEALTQGAMEDVAPVLTALLAEPSSVFDSRVCPSSPQSYQSLSRRLAEEEVQHHSGVALDGCSTHLTHLRDHTARAARRHVGGIMGLEQLRLFDVENTPLSSSLRKLLPRLCHCVRDGRREAEKTTTAQQHAGSGESDDDSGSGAAPRSSFHRHNRRGIRDTDSDDDSAVGSFLLSDALRMTPSSSPRRDPVHMRSVMVDLLHKLFGSSCSVQY
ncbi:hypothetical protein ABL78_3015 [Leptomonas seymouri]|uniref:Leucine-rich repeat protein n=1 Tax=Leptomonas seymouri TaxID=5684 RepID=A0A0N1I5F5_LEPSE|nr:hypothetical protein ABL78_3015 [Leptomonas seymouri]|eukprot:KPI87905.1 hypothetical protein ABL78_3015 [Leptomonas seymouri]